MERTSVLKKIAATFIIMTVALFALVAYVALSRATIRVRLGGVEREATFRLTLAEDAFGRPRPAGALSAAFLETTGSAEGAFVPSGAAERSGKAGGIVSIQNSTDRPQPLVATTRLLTPEGILFRITEAVRVPARGSVTVPAEADEAGPRGEVGSTSFTIPGLSQNLQSQIFATSSTPMVRGGAEAKVITAQDLETARQSLKQQVISRVRPALQVQAGQSSLEDDDFIVQTVTEQSSGKANTPARSFTMSAKLKVVAVLLNKDEMHKRAVATMGNTSGSGLSRIQYVIANYDSVNRTATLSGRGSITTSLDERSSIFLPDNFVGTTPDEVKSFLKNYEGVQDVEVRISPYWQRYLPRFPSRITVEFTTK